MSALSVRHEVSRVFIKDDVVFCHQYPTGTCVGGNSWVRSFRDNVASACTGRQPIREVTLRLPALSDPSAVQLASLCMFCAVLLKEPFILPLEDEALDIVLFNSGVEHLTDPDKALSEIHRILKREGFAVFSGPGIYPKHEYPIDNMLRFPTERILGGSSERSPGDSRVQKNKTAICKSSE